jgi:hypothetical protein
MKRAWLVAVFAVLAAAPSRAATLYYNAAVDTAWDTLGNWWTDSGHTVPSAALPTNGDAVVMSGNLGTGPSVAVQPASVTWSSGNNSVNLSAFVCVVTFNDESRNSGTVTTGTFNGTSYNSGTVTTGTFNDGSYNGGTVTTGTFNDSSGNSGTVTTGTFNDGSNNFSTVTTGTFNDSSGNTDGTVTTGTFNDSSGNAGGTVTTLLITSTRIAGEWVANGSRNAATIGGTVIRTVATGAAFPTAPTARGGSNAIVP